MQRCLFFLVILVLPLGSAPAAAAAGRPPCDPGYVSTYSGPYVGYTCVPVTSPINEMNCPPGSAVTGFKDGQPSCSPVAMDFVCPDGEAVTGLKNGVVSCAPISSFKTGTITISGCDADTNQSGTMTVSCPPGFGLLSCFSGDILTQKVDLSSSSCSGRSWDITQSPPRCDSMTITCGSQQ